MKRLKHESDALSPQPRAPIFIELSQIDTFEEHVPARGQLEPREEGEQRRLAGA
jgi:hypothetical protein